jgi:hypothetical protein
MPITTVHVGDVIKDRSGMTGTVTRTPDMLNIRPYGQGMPLEVCLCDVSTEVGRRAIMFILERCHLIRAAGEVEPA